MADLLVLLLTTRRESLVSKVEASLPDFSGNHTYSSPPLACSFLLLRYPKEGSAYSRARGRRPRLAHGGDILRGGMRRDSVPPDTYSQCSKFPGRIPTTFCNEESHVWRLIAYSRRDCHILSDGASFQRPGRCRRCHSFNPHAVVTSSHAPFGPGTQRRVRLLLCRARNELVLYTNFLILNSEMSYLLLLGCASFWGRTVSSIPTR